MKILAIETATTACSAALNIDDHGSHRFAIVPRQHTALILPMVDDLLQEAGIQIRDLDAIAFGQGPGAFTGVRIAVAVTQGLAFAHDTPVIPVSTLQALAQHYADDHTHIAAAIDARMQEIYWGLFARDAAGLMQSITAETVCAPTAILDLPPDLPKGKWFGVGSGWATYIDTLQAQFTQTLIGFDGQLLPSAEAIMTLAKPAYLAGQMIAVEQAKPVYLRNKIINN